MIICKFQCCSLKLSNSQLLPQSPKVCSLYLCLFCCLAHRVIITIFLNSIHWVNILCYCFSLWLTSLCISTVQSLIHVWLLETPWITACQARTPCPSPTPRVYSNSCPSSQWWHRDISSSVARFSFCPQSLLASGSFPMSQLFTWGGQSTGASASASVLPMNTQDWSPLGWTGWNSLQSKGLPRVFSNTTVQKHQFFSTQLSSQSNSHIHTWPLEKP